MNYYEVRHNLLNQPVKRKFLSSIRGSQKVIKACSVEKWRNSSLKEKFSLQIVMFMFYDVMNIIEGLNMISDNKQKWQKSCFFTIFWKITELTHTLPSFHDSIIFITNYANSTNLHHIKIIYFLYFSRRLPFKSGSRFMSNVIIYGNFIFFSSTQKIYVYFFVVLCAEEERKFFCHFSSHPSSRSCI